MGGFFRPETEAETCHVLIPLLWFQEFLLDEEDEEEEEAGASASSREFPVKARGPLLTLPLATVEREQWIFR
jgi:hypothetical protein